jgi:hypothetical protein
MVPVRQEEVRTWPAQGAAMGKPLLHALRENQSYDPFKRVGMCGERGARGCHFAAKKTPVAGELKTRGTRKPL